MRSLLDVVRLHVRDVPYVRGILPQRISRCLPSVWSLEVLLAGILRGNANWIDIEIVVVRLREPHDGLVSSGKSLCAVQPVAKAPDDSVAQLQSMRLEHVVQDNVQRHDFSIAHVIAHLPTKRSIGVKRPHALGYDGFLLLQVPLQACALLVGLSDVVGRGSDNQLDRSAGHRRKEVQVVGAFDPDGEAGVRSVGQFSAEEVLGQSSLGGRESSGAGGHGRTVPNGREAVKTGGAAPKSQPPRRRLNEPPYAWTSVALPSPRISLSA